MVIANEGGIKMQRQQVESSNLESIGHEEQVLEIEFKDGSVYQYFDVPKDEHTNLMNAESHGKYFSANIKNKYRYKKL